MTKYYAVGGVIDLEKPKIGFFGGLEGPYQKISLEFLTHILYQNMRCRNESDITNQKIPQIYLFRTLEDAQAFSNNRQKKAYADNRIALSPIFSIEVNDFEFEFQKSRLADMPLETYTTAAEIHFIEENKLADFLKSAIYKNSYVAVKKEPLVMSQIFYVRENGTHQLVHINNMEKFWDQYAPIYKYNHRSSLTYEKVNKLITKNGGHTPDYSFKKKAAEIKKEISWARVEDSMFSRFKKDCTIEEIKLPGYVKDNENIYYQEHIKREADRSLLDMEWWVALLIILTCVTILIPIVYFIGRYSNRVYAQTILKNIDQPNPELFNEEQWVSIDNSSYSECIIDFSLAYPALEKDRKQSKSLLSSNLFPDDESQETDSSEEDILLLDQSTFPSVKKK